MRPRSRQEDSIKVDLKEARCEGVKWIQLAQDKVRWFLTNITLNGSDYEELYHQGYNTIHALYP